MTKHKSPNTTSTSSNPPPAASTAMQPLLTVVTPAEDAVDELRLELTAQISAHREEMLALQRQMMAHIQALADRLPPVTAAAAVQPQPGATPTTQPLHSAPPDEEAPIKTNPVLEGDVKQVSDIMVFAASVEHKSVGDGEILQMAYCHLETEHHMFDKMPERSVSVQQSAVHEGLLGGFPLLQSEVLQQHLGSIVHTKQMDVNDDTQNKFKRIGIGVDSIGTYEANKGAPKVLEEMLDTETEVAYESLLTVLRLELRDQPPSVISDAADMIVACSNGFEDASENEEMERMRRWTSICVWLPITPAIVDSTEILRVAWDSESFERVMNVFIFGGDITETNRKFPLAASEEALEKGAMLEAKLQREEIFMEMIMDVLGDMPNPNPDIMKKDFGIVFDVIMLRRVDELVMSLKKGFAKAQDAKLENTKSLDVFGDSEVIGFRMESGSVRGVASFTTVYNTVCRFSPLCVHIIARDTKISYNAEALIDQYFLFYFIFGAYNDEELLHL